MMILRKSLKKKNEISALHIDLNTSILCCSFSRGREEKIQWQNDRHGMSLHFISVP